MCYLVRVTWCVTTVGDRFLTNSVLLGVALGYSVSLGGTLGVMLCSFVSLSVPMCYLLGSVGLWVCLSQG